MLSVLHLTKCFSDPPQRPHIPSGVRIVASTGMGDAERWQTIQRLALANMPTRVRPPTTHDLQRELFSQPAWSPAWLWFAESDSDEGESLGTVALSLRGDQLSTSPENARPGVHRLAVVPAARGRGIGRALLQTLERAAWQAGHRQLWLETHAAWEPAVNLYRRMHWQ